MIARSSYDQVVNQQRSLTAKVRRLARKLGAVRTSDQDGVMATLKIARRLVNEGWCKGAAFRMVNDKPQYDPEAALRSAATMAAPKDSARAFWAAYRALNRALPSAIPAWTVQTYNDHPNTSKQDILDLFDRAIKNQGSFGVALEKGPDK